MKIALEYDPLSFYIVTHVYFRYFSIKDILDYNVHVNLLFFYLAKIQLQWICAALENINILMLLFSMYNDILKKTTKIGYRITCIGNTPSVYFTDIVIIAFCTFQSCATYLYKTGCNNASVYGRNCDTPCPINCKDSTCHIKSGSCFTCKLGWIGIYCETSEIKQF